MGRQTNLATELRKWGLDVVEHDGWTERGSATFNPAGVVDHHTASNANGGDANSLNICIHGRADLPGPLAQVVLARSGRVHVIAAGRANHAGSGGFRGLSGNSSVFGIEAENNGVGEPWSDAQVEAYARVNAAMCSLAGRDASWVCGHKEWTTRKIDPAGIDMNWMRERVAQLLGGNVTPMPSAPVVAAPAVSQWRAESGSTLEFGEKGPRVKAWQQNIVTYAGGGLTADGYFGNDTKNRTIDFQKFFGLTADGIVGPKTLAMMDHIIAQRTQVSRPTLRKGNKGDAVRELQNWLNRAANAGVWEDGDFGTKTDAAVRNFQRFFGLGVDGVVGAKTWNMLSYILVTTGK